MNTSIGNRQSAIGNRQGLSALGSRLPTKAGFIAMATVLIIGAVLLIVGIATASLGHTQLQVAAGADQENRLRNYVVACMEEGIIRLKRNPSYTGGTVPIDGETCTVAVSGSDPSRTMTISATADGYTEANVITLTRRTNPDAAAVAWVIDDWQEVVP